MKTHKLLTTGIFLFLAVSTACISSLPTVDLTAEQVPTAVVLPTLAATDAVETEAAPVTGHLMKPSDVVPAPLKTVEDVTSSEAGAPYGDSYKLNRFERPFLQDMTYVADMDITGFSLSEDQDWYYVSIRVTGSDPNNPLGINFGAEIDLNADGSGDYMVWSRPPYTTQWSTSTVQIFQDSNNDTGGPSSIESDAVSDGNGYDTLVFDGSMADNSDPDLAWVRLSPELPGLLQIAFKKALTGPAFLLGVVTDGGLKDVSKYDYVDHVTVVDAGSPVKNDRHFPLGSLYSVDNTCWEAVGIQTTGFEAKLCQPFLQPVNTQESTDNDNDPTPLPACNPPPDCGGGPYNPETCQCE